VNASSSPCCDNSRCRHRRTPAYSRIRRYGALLRHPRPWPPAPTRPVPNLLWAHLLKYLCSVCIESHTSLLLRLSLLYLKRLFAAHHEHNLPYNMAACTVGYLVIKDGEFSDVTAPYLHCEPKKHQNVIVTSSTKPGRFW